MKNKLHNIYYSFPIQLIVINIKSNLLLLTFWLIMVAMISGNFGKLYGLHYVFLDPEYLGKVGFWSFFIIGVAFSGFLLAWNTTIYILNSFRFPFLASLNRPFAKFSLNNGVIPLLFVTYYLSAVIQFQLYNEFAAQNSIFFYVFGFLTGMFTGLLIASFYYYKTNNDILSVQSRKIFSKKLSKILSVRKDNLYNSSSPYLHARKLEYYMTEGFRWRRVRQVGHYSPELLDIVFKQNHTNALVIQTFAITFLIVLGVTVEIPAFRIPAAASFLILIAVLTTLLGALSYWLGQWRTPTIIILIFLINWLMSFDFFYHENHAYGLDYKNRQEYNVTTIDSLQRQNFIKEDINNNLEILENWKAKFPTHKKPPLVIVCTSGGGLRAALWSMKVMQLINNKTKGKTFEHTSLISGSSGGMLGLAYYRDLYYQNQTNSNLNPNDRRHQDNVSKDIINPVIFTYVVNDVFLPWVKFKYNGLKYRKDRGYIFEQQLLENLKGFKDRKLSDYREPEKKAQIPMMIHSPVVINDGRQLLISSQKVSYLASPQNSWGHNEGFEPDGVDFLRLFDQQGAENLRFTSALRMGATFPYVLPIVYLPSNPPIQVMDAGFRDNYGIKTAYRYLLTFKDWIKQNTSGVVLIEIRGSGKMEKVPKLKRRFTNNLFSPIGTTGDFVTIQDYNHDNYINQLIETFGKDNFNRVTFAYLPSKEEASISLHLSNKGKKDIERALSLPNNIKSLKFLNDLIK